MQSAVTTLGLAVALADVASRARVAAELSRHLGVDEVLLFAPDPELGTLLPAPGWPQTLPHAASMRAALAECTSVGVHHVRVRRRDNTETAVVAVTSSDGIVLALVGGEPAAQEVEQLQMILPLVTAAVSAELAARIAEGNAASARDASRHAQDLAKSLDATRLQLETSLRESAALADEAERARQRIALLDRVTRELVGESHDIDTALGRVALAVVPALADWCAVYVPTPDGSTRIAAVADSSSSVEARDQSVRESVPEVLRTGVTRHVATPNGHLAVALKGHERLLGVLALTMTSARSFAEEDRALAEEIANRAALLLEQRRLLEEARAARESAERASRAKDEFLAMLGHELRNPLAPIATALSLMKMRGEQGMRAERAVIERQIQHVVHLVDDLLDVSRITGGKIELRRETLSVRDVMTTAVEMALPLIEERRHRLEVDVEASLLVDGDARRLAQVVSNLLNNAAKYTPDGGALYLRAAREGETAVITVRDNGIGMDADLVPRVFELFAQAPQMMDRSKGGLGLGLAIVKSLVDLHGGSVVARSEGRGHGSELVVRLPAVEASAAKVAAPVAEVVAARPRKILVVDDNEDAVWLLSQLLATIGHEVQSALDGPSALQLLERFAPDVALLDIGLPVMDGFELAGHVRAKFPGILLIAITGYGQAADREATSAAGFNAHLVKPVDIEDIEKLLDPHG